MQQYYDFLVRYEEVLGVGTTDATETRAAALTIDGIEQAGLRSKNRVGVFVRQGAGFETFSLVNFLGLAHGKWAETLLNGPEPQTDLAVTLAVERPVSGVWITSPDKKEIAPQMVGFSANEESITIAVPRLDYWTMIVVEYAS